MAEQAQQESPTRRTAAEVRASVLGVLAGLVRWVGLVVVVILVIRVVLTVGGANPHNGITSFITSWSDPLAWGFKDLFTPTDAKLRVLVNYGLAALCWLVVSSILARIIRRFA
jgi:phage shock protein PspC (stress-responsive transcriptional regulator)